MIDYFEAYKKELITQYAQEEGHEVTNKDSEFWVDHIARGNQCDRDLMVLLRERDNAIVRAKKAESEISAEREVPLGLLQSACIFSQGEDAPLPVHPCVPRDLNLPHPARRLPPARTPFFGRCTR